MKTYQRILGMALTFGLVVVPAYAAVESASGAPQTMAEFQKMYSGTKPVIAAEKFQASQYVKELPRPTLTISRIRVEDVVTGQGTKPGVLPAFGSAHTWMGGEATSSKPSVRR